MAGENGARAGTGVLGGAEAGRVGWAGHRGRGEVQAGGIHVGSSALPFHSMAAGTR